MLWTSLTLIALIFATSYLTAMEIAFFSLEELDFQTIAQSQDKKAKILLDLKHNREQLILSLVVGINFINISASAINANMALYLATDNAWSKDWVVVIATVLLTLVIILLGEAVPKIIGIRANLALCWYNAYALQWIYTITKPFVWVVVKLTRFIAVLHIVQKQTTPERFQAAFIGFTEKSAKEGLLRADEGEVIQNVLGLRRKVAQIMRPRNQVFALKSDLKVADCLEKVLEKKYSRIPIYQEDLDSISGLVLLKDILHYSLTNKEQILISELASPPIFVQEVWTIWNVLNILKRHKSHLAVVVDEYGGVNGIITLEDILEEVVGEIDDEKDSSFEGEYAQIDMELWEFNGMYSIHNLNKVLDLHLEELDSFETLQGLFMHEFKRIPMLGDKLVRKNFSFEVALMDKNEIKKVQVRKLPSPDELAKN